VLFLADPEILAARQLPEAPGSDLAEPYLRDVEGREIDTAGDGFLISFDGAARAVQCAMAVRERVRRLSRGHPPHLRVALSPAS
jgi:class 3 adenylate cyclase